MLKVFLGNAPWRPNGRLGVRAGSRWPWSHKNLEGKKRPDLVPFPFFLAYATSVVEKAGFDVVLVDAIADGLSDDEFLEKVKSSSPDVVVLETSTPSIDYDLRTAKSIKEQTGALIVFCGPHVSVLGEDLLKQNSFVDFCLIGEYEIVLKNLCIALEKKSALSAVKGLIYRRGSAVVNNKRAPLVNVDELPWPHRTHIDMRNYSDALFSGMPVPDVQMWASRGCPFKCVFCLWPTTMYGGHTYRARNPLDVVNEMEFLVKEYGFKSIYFDDDSFDIGKERILKLCDEIKKRPALNGIKWVAMARADTCDYEMLKAMKDAGLYGIKYGVESGVQQIVDNIHKNLNLDVLKKNIALTKELGIKVHLTFTFGLPGETWETIKKTILFSHELDPDSIQFSITTPFPGTEFFDALDKQNRILTKDWSNYDGAQSCVYKTENLSRDDLERAIQMAHDSWKLPLFKKNIVKYLKMGVANPVEAVRYVVTGLKYYRGANFVSEKNKNLLD